MTLSQEPNESLASTDLLEASLARIWQHNRDRAFVILTAWRSDLDSDTNEKSLAALKKKVRADGYGFISVEGVGDEDGKTVSEPSLVVLSQDDPADADGAFLKRAIPWAKTYDQYSVFYHVVRDGEPLGAEIRVSAGAPVPGRENLSTFTPNKLAGFYSNLRGHGSFKYEWMGVKFSDPAQGWINGMGRESTGEICMDLCERVETWKKRMQSREPVLVHAEMVELSRRLAETIAAEPRYHAKPQVYAGQYIVMVQYDRPEGGVRDLGRVAVARNGKPNVAFLEAHQDKIAALLA